MTKKMTKDEAYEACKEWRFHCLKVTELRDDGSEITVLHDRKPIASFPFQPSHPEIGTTCKLWNNDGWIIAKIERVDDINDLLPFKAKGGNWYGNAEPYTLIDPAEHAKLRRENNTLIDNNKSIGDDRKILRAEYDRLKSEHAKAKQAEAVLAELLPVCEEIVESRSLFFTPNPVFDLTGKLEELLK